MKCLSLAAVLLVLFLGLGGRPAQATHPTGAVPMNKFRVDLNQPPDKRWIPLLSVYNSSGPLILDYFKNEGTVIQQSVLDYLMSNVTAYFGEYGIEMKAIADYFGIDLGVIVTLNLSYELRRLNGGRINTTGNVTSTHKNSGGIACTSILAANKRGEVFHGRTLDWALPLALRNLTVQVEFTRGDEVLFTGDLTVGSVGVPTGVSKKGRFSISINERALGGSVADNLADRLLKKSKPPTLWAREVLTNATSYVEAVEMLQSEPLIAPVYYITAGAGPNEGAVITRSRDKCKDMLTLGTTAENGTQPWYLLETNYDHWKKVKPYDNRRGYAIQYLNEMGQDKVATVEGITSIVSKWPIRNNYTSSTTIMVPGDYSKIQSYDNYP